MSEPSECIYVLSSKQIRKCDGNTGNCCQVYEGHLEPVNSICFTSNFGMFVSASKDEKLIIWDADTGEKLRVLEGHTSWVNCVAISPDDLTIVSGGHDHTIKVWDLPTGKLKIILLGHEYGVLSVAISPTGEKIASGSCDTTVRIWSLLGVGTLLFTLKGHIGHVYSVIFTPGAAGQQVISGSVDRSVRVWNVDNGVNIGTIDTSSQVFSLAVNSFGDKVVCGCGDGSVCVYNLRTRQLIRRMDGHPCWVSVVAITPNEQHIISASIDTSVIKWRVESGEIQTFAGSVWSVACCPSALISDCDIQLKFSGRIVNTSSRGIVYTINPQTRVETREDNVILREEEIVVAIIKTSDVAKALEWKDWILAVKHHINLPIEQRARTASGIMTRYKADWLQTMNILEQGCVNYLSKHTMKLIMDYMFK